MLKTRLLSAVGLIMILSTGALHAQGPPGGPMSFISRLDVNKNGQLDPDEQGRARPFLERIARETGGLDLNRPISLQALAGKVQQMQNGGGGDQSRDRSRGLGDQPLPVLKRDFGLWRAQPTLPDHGPGPIQQPCLDRRTRRAH